MNALSAIGSKLAQRQDLTDSDFYSFLAELDLSAAGGRASDAQASSAAPPPASASDGGMRLTKREAEIRVSEHRCQPASTALALGTTCTIAVQSGPPQSFSIGRDVEEAFVTPAIPAGHSYRWVPPEAGRYIVSSEVYPHLRSAVKVTSAPETTPAAADLPATGSSSPADSRRASDGMAAADVEQFIRFPLLNSRPGLPAAPAVAGCARSNGGSSSGEAVRNGHATQMLARNPGDPETTSTAAGTYPPTISRFALPVASRPSSGSSAAATSTDEEAAGAEKVPGSPPADSGLRRRGRTGAAASASVGVSSAPSLASMLTGRQVVENLAMQQSNGLGGSPRSGSGSGSERSSTSAPLYVQRRVPVPGGMLSTTHAYSMGARSGSSAYSDSRSSAEEAQPLLYSLGQPRPPHMQSASYGNSYAYSRDPAVGGGGTAGTASGEARGPTQHKCPRCRKEYVSTINQRRCISSHLGGASGLRGAVQGVSGGMPDAKQLAEFWDGMTEADKRPVMDVCSEPNGELIMRQLEAQLLHRKRDGQLDALSREQRRLHTAGKMLHQFCTGFAGTAGSSFSGSNLTSVLSQVSEGTFLCGTNTINRAEFSAGDNLEAGLGALVTKRLVEAHLRAKQRDAERLQRELEDLETAQAVQRGKQQQGNGALQVPGAGGKKKSKAKGKVKSGAAAAAAKPAAAAASTLAAPATAAPKEAAAAAAEVPSIEDAACEGAAAVPPAKAGISGAAAQAAASQQTNDVAAEACALSPPTDGGRYGSSPTRPSNATSSFTNVLFAADAAAEGEAAPTAAAPAAGTTAAAESGKEQQEEEEEGKEAGHAANDWLRASSSRPSSRAARGDSQPAAHSTVQAAGGAAKGSATTSRLPRRGSGGSTGSAAPERGTARAAAAERFGGGLAATAAPKVLAAKAQARPAVPSAAAASPADKLTGSRHATGAEPARQPAAQQAAAVKQPAIQPNSFPALPSAVGSKPAAAVKVAAVKVSVHPANGVTATANGGSAFTYAAAAAAAAAKNKQKETAAAAATAALQPPPQQSQKQPQQVQEQAADAPGSDAQRLTSGQTAAASGMPNGTSAVPPPAAAPATAPAATAVVVLPEQQAAAASQTAPAARAAVPGLELHMHPEAVVPLPRAELLPVLPGVQLAAPAAAADAAGAAPEAAAAAATAPPGDVALAAGEGEEMQRAGSVTPPISEPGSPPPAGMLHGPPDGFPGHPMAWVGPDGCLMGPPHMGYYYMVPPMAPPPGMQFGSLDMQEVGPPGHYPAHYQPAYFHPAHYQLPPGHLGAAPGMPPPHHHPGMGFSEGPLPPFPPGMPMPLPPEAAEELAAAARAHDAGQLQLEPQEQQQQEGSEWPETSASSGAEAGAEVGAEAETKEPEGAEQPAAGVEDSAAFFLPQADHGCEPGQEQQPGEPEQRQQPQPQQQQQQQQQQPKGGFLALLEAACGTLPAPAHQAPQLAPRGRRQPPRFDAAAAAAEFERRWQAAAPKLAALQPNGTAAQPPRSAAPAKKHSSSVAALKAAAKAPRSSSPGAQAGGKGGAWSGKAGSAGASGRSSPGGVVVAVRAWSIDEGAGDARWQIHSAKQQQ
ncbi:hypothetical protein D9Q98_007706 [Chlorella vulgaris]|uniref:Uncharacterized protein n=1 Tax=Chlorella vulgaris TaxID=3077 RepID=A0A9D4YTK4_CHLVU|nr:hypothetical protein D9Q98_007706 [Chlorella vulgaris]